MAVLRALYREHIDQKKAENSHKELTHIEKNINNNFDVLSPSIDDLKEVPPETNDESLVKRYNESETPSEAPSVDMNRLKNELNRELNFKNHLNFMLKRAQKTKVVVDSKKQAKKVNAIKTAYISSYTKEIITQLFAAITNIGIIACLIFLGAFCMAKVCFY